MPYTIFLLILKNISSNAIYVSIFLILLMLFITFISSKVQNKKSFVKCFRRKAGCSCDNVGFVYKSYTVTAIPLIMSSSLMISSISSHLPPASPQPMRGICTLASCFVANRATSFKHCRTAS